MIEELFCKPWTYFFYWILTETPILWPPHVKSWLIGKDSDAGRDWGQEEKGTTEDEMAGWHHWLDGRESKWTPGVGDWQGGLACCDSWGRKESDMTERLNWTELNYLLALTAKPTTFNSFHVKCFINKIIFLRKTNICHYYKFIELKKTNSNKNKY